LGVLHREHLSELSLHLDNTTIHQNFVTMDKARFDGDLLGIVAAADPRTARRAVEMIQVEYELLPAVFSAAEALLPNAPLIHEEVGTNLAFEDSLEWGDVELGFKEADHIFEETFVSPSVYHHPMEPTASSLVNFTADRLDIWMATNVPFHVAEVAAKVFALQGGSIRVRVPPVGGNFGAKDHSPEITVLAALSRKIGRPVKLLASAEESFRVTARHAMIYRAKVGVKSDGRLVALDVNLEIDTGAYFTGAAIATNNAITSASGAYRTPHLRVKAHRVHEQSSGRNVS
jgi:CO/xanthine dehydrogenase Mo-binding subunit